MNKFFTPSWLLGYSLLLSMTIFGSTNSVFAQSCDNDVEPPTINLNTADTIYHEISTPYSAIKPRVTDNCSDSSRISLTKKSNVNPFVVGCYTDTYTAIDQKGNQTEKLRYVCVEMKQSSGLGTDLQKNTLTIYPNPSSGLITIGYSSQLTSSYEITIFDVLGNVIWHMPNVKDKTTVDLTSNSKGIYLIQLSDGSKNLTQKVVLH